ncbi:Zinc finger, U1-type, partial [Corchorus capsularis]
MGEERRTMSMELALQREMEYRRKLERLQLFPSVDSGDEILPVQVQPKIGSSSKIIPPPQQLQASKNPNVFCEVCQVPCSGSLNYQQHINGKMHKLKLEASKLARKDGGAGASNSMANEKPYCKLCGVWCSDYDLLRQHLGGKKHKKMQAKLGHGEIAAENRCE